MSSCNNDHEIISMGILCAHEYLVIISIRTNPDFNRMKSAGVSLLPHNRGRTVAGVLWRYNHRTVMAEEAKSRRAR